MSEVARLAGAALLVLATVLGGACGRSHGPTLPARPGAVQEGNATWYGPRHHGRRTASGEPFDQWALTAAHRTLPFGSQVRVVNRKNGKVVVLRINDRGPYGSATRIIDVSRAGADRLDMRRAGVVPVTVEVLHVPPPKARRPRGRR